jgi:hypothetical protein
MRHIVVSSLYWSNIYFSHYLKNFTLFGKMLLNQNVLVDFSPPILSQTCLILRLNQRNVINAHRSSSQATVLLLLLLLGPGGYCPRKYCSLQAYCTIPAFEVPTCTARRRPPTPSTTRETSSRERSGYGQEIFGEFCRQIASSTLFERDL